MPRVSTPDFVANHLEMARIAAAHGAAILVVGPVYRDAVTDPEAARRIAERRRALAAALAGAGVAYLEVPRLTEAGHPGNAPLFLEEVHPSTEGHALLAGAIGERLADADFDPRGESKPAAQ